MSLSFQQLALYALVLILGDTVTAMRAFDARYTALLRQINAALDGRPDLLRDAVHGMFDLKHRGVALMRLRLPDGRTAGPAWRFAPEGA